MTSLFETAKNSGFLLFETMIGVAIFALAILGLGRCVVRCVDAETARVWNERARTALGNRMAEIRAGAVPTEAKKEVLEGKFNGIVLTQMREAVRVGKREIGGLSEVRLEASWNAAGARQSQTLIFDVLEKK
jgi:Tfp pilus assembly protein PilV